MVPGFTVTFWGVRGSAPSPGPATVRYGGNTSCVSVAVGGGKLLVFDAGTGIRGLGKAIAGGTGEIFLLLSHPHWDHVQGFPFFRPLYEPGRRIYMFPTPQAHTMLCALIEQMDGAHFPVTPDTLPAHPECITEDAMGFLRVRGLAVSRIPTNHPGGGYGYRVEHEGKAVVYLTDNELEPPYPKATEFDGFVRFCRRAEVLIHDAQYLERDLPHKHGWGHSLVSQVCALARAAEVRHLVLFHHDPDRTDDELDAILADAQQSLSAERVDCTVAFEGLTLRI